MGWRALQSRGVRGMSARPVHARGGDMACLDWSRADPTRRHTGQGGVDGPQHDTAIYLGVVAAGEKGHVPCQPEDDHDRQDGKCAQNQPDLGANCQGEKGQGVGLQAAAARRRGIRAGMPAAANPLVWQRHGPPPPHLKAPSVLASGAVPAPLWTLQGCGDRGARGFMPVPRSATRVHPILTPCPRLPPPSPSNHPHTSKLCGRVMVWSWIHVSSGLCAGN